MSRPEAAVAASVACSRAVGSGGFWEATDANGWIRGRGGPFCNAAGDHASIHLRLDVEECEAARLKKQLESVGHQMRCAQQQMPGQQR